MGIRAIFDEVRTIVQTADPLVEFLMTAETQQFQGAPPKVVWEMPLPGMEEFSRTQLGPGYSGSVTPRKLWTRKVTCNVHVWMDSDAVVDADGYDWPDDNETPADGSVWLVQQVVQAIHSVTAGQYEMIKGGWGDRTMANLGWLYVFQVSFLLPVFDSAAGLTTATITSATITPIAETS